jgi:hypothetical protein
MVDRLEFLFQQWHRLGGAVLLAQVDPDVESQSPEQVIAQSTALCRQSGRLMWVTLDWLIRHIDQIEPQSLINAARDQGDLSVLGVLCDAASQRRSHSAFTVIMRQCQPNSNLEPFFHRVAHSPLATRLTEENALEVFRRWNYLCSELRYLDDRVGSAA